MDAMPPDLEALLANSGFVRRLAGALVRDAVTADDVAQDAILIALERPPRDGRNPRGWLASVVRSISIDRARRTASRAEVEARARELLPVPQPDEIVGRLEISQRVAEAVRQLEEPYRTAIYLRYFEDLEPDSIGQRLAVPVPTVKTRLRRGLAHLREALDREFGSRATWSELVLPLLPSPTSSTLVTGIFAMGSTWKIVCSLVACAALAWLAWPGRTHIAGDSRSDLVRADESQLSDPGTRTRTRAPAAQNAVAAGFSASEPVPDDAPCAVVLDERRFPVAGAHVRLHVRGVGDEEAVTDADGRARFALGAKLELARHPASLLAWDSSGRAAALDCRLARQRASAFAALEKRLLGVMVLSPGCALVVRAADNSGPVAGAAITLELGAHRSIVIDAITGADGRALFEHLPPLMVTACASRTGHVGREATVLAAGREMELVVRLAPVRVVEVQVVDAETKEPISNARVSVGEPIHVTTDDFEIGLQPGRTFSRTLPFDLEVPRTDEAGRTRISGLAPGTRCEISADAEDFRGPRSPAPAAALDEVAKSITIELTSLHRRQVRWPLERGEIEAPANGTVLALRTETAPRWSLETAPSPPTSARIERGAIVADNVVDGQALLAVSPEGSIARLWTQDGNAVGEPTSFRRSRRVEVTVQDADGRPAAGLELDLCNAGNNLLLPPLKTDSNGKAIFQGLWGRRAIARIASRPIGSVDLETGDGHIEARLPRTDSREISVRLLLEGVPGLPTSYQVRAGPGSSLTAEDPATGIVRLRVAATGDTETVAVSVDALGFQPGTGTAPLDGREIVDIPLAAACRMSAHVLLPPTGKVRIRVERFDLETNEWVMGPDGSVTGERYAANAPDGRFLFGELAPGRYRVRDVVSKLASDRIDLPGPGSAAEVCLDLSSIVRVRGVVELPEGISPQSARVVLDGADISEPKSNWNGIRRPVGGTYVDKDGRFEVFVSSARPIRLCAWHPWLSPDASSGSYRVQDATDDVRLKLVAGDEVRMPVAGWFEKHTPASLRVYAYRAEPRGEPDHVLEAAIVDGTARFSGLPRGTWTLWIDPERVFAPIIVRGVVVGTGITNVVAKPVRGSSLRVRVLHEGSQAPRIYVFAQRRGEPTLRRELNSSREGLVTLSGLDAGTFEVHISAGMGKLTLERKLEIDGVQDAEIEVDAREIRD